jgi:predicted nucleic acid-binding protein/GNAT superfamily N-acetyltransferase
MANTIAFRSFAGYRFLKTSQEVEPYVAQVAQWADENRDSFGFLPVGSYSEAAARGRLWIAVDSSNSLAAYLFFGGRFPNISVTQLFVKPAARRARLGHLLIEELKKYAEVKAIQTVSARVAADLEANSFWEKCDFLLLRQIQGGQTKNRTINVRVFEVPDCSLWQADSGSSNSSTSLFGSRSPALVPNYVLDLNVFFDVVKGRVDAENAQRLVGAAMANRLRICVTNEFVEELRRHTRDEARDPLLNLAKSLPTLPLVSAYLLKGLIAELRRLIFPEAQRSPMRKPNDDSDLIHLATCIHHKTSAFITREKAILRAADELDRRYQLEVVSPADILQSDGERSPDLSRISANIAGSSFFVQAMAEDQRAKAAEFLLRKVSLNRLDVGDVLDPGTSSFHRSRWIGFVDDEVVGFCSYKFDGVGGAHLDGFLAVDERSLAAQQFIDHILQRLAAEQPPQEACLVSLRTVDSQQMVISTALSRAYFPREKSNSERLVRLQRVGFRGVVTPTSWDNFRRKLLRDFDTRLPERPPTFLEAANTGLAIVAQGSTEPKPRRLANFEKVLAPLLLVLAGRPGSLVPIREPFAQELFQLPVSQIPLLPGKEAQLRIERAYFGKSGFEKAFARDGLVIFYVSGSDNGRKAAVGIARVTFAGKVSLEKAKHEFLRHGVLEHQTLEAVASKEAAVGMFSFDSFFPFSAPVPYGELLRLKCIGGANLVTAQKLTYSQVLKIVEAGFK